MIPMQESVAARPRDVLQFGRDANVVQAKQRMRKCHQPEERHEKATITT